MKAGKPWVTGKGRNRQIHVYVYSSTAGSRRRAKGNWKIKLSNRKADWDTSWIGKAR
jgi:hypothetical protein